MRAGPVGTCDACGPIGTVTPPATDGTPWTGAQTQGGAAWQRLSRQFANVEFAPARALPGQPFSVAVMKC